MSLLKKLLTGLSTIALSAATGAGMQASQAANAPRVTTMTETAATETASAVVSLSAMSLVELRQFVAANLDPTAAPEDAALQFAGLLAELTGDAGASPDTLIAAANAFQLMVEELQRTRGPFDARAVLAQARANYVASLPTAAGQTAAGDGTFEPDLTEFESPY